MEKEKFKWLMIAICVVAMSASCAYIFRDTFRTSKQVAAAKKNHLGKYCYIDGMNIVHADRHCKKLGYKDMMPPTRVRTERYDLEGSIEGYCPTCVSDDDYEVLVELKKRPPSRRPPLFDDKS